MLDGAEPMSAILSSGFASSSNSMPPSEQVKDLQVEVVKITELAAANAVDPVCAMTR